MIFAAANHARVRSAVAARFQKLLERVEPTSSESAGYGRHKSSIDAAIGTATVRIGSASRGTATRGASDLDLLAKMSRSGASAGGRPDRSDVVLRRLRDRLDASFALTQVRRDGVAVVVKFARGQRAVDVVPAVFAGMEAVSGVGTMRPVFRIPTGDGRWQSTSPDAHNVYIASADRASGYKLKRIARLLKFWRGCRSPETPLQSFHAELVLAATRACIGAKPHSVCLRDAFAALAGRQGRGLQDPIGISGIIPAAPTRSAAEMCHRALLYAHDHAARAVDAEQRGTFAEAHRQWNIVFNGCFPS